MLGFLVSDRQDLFFLAIGVGANAQRLLFALRAILSGDAFAFCSHSGVDALLVLLRQVQALDAHIDHLDAVLSERDAIRAG